MREFGRPLGMGGIMRLANAACQMLAHAYEYDFGSEYEYEISVRMFASVAHWQIICVAFANHSHGNVSGLRNSFHALLSLPCLITLLQMRSRK